MASSPNSTGNERLFSRSQVNDLVARALGREARAQRTTNEKLEKLTGIPERQVEALRSFSEEVPIYLEDILSLATVLGPRFLTGLLSEIDMYAAQFNGSSPEKIAGEIIELATKLTGGDGK